MIHNLALSAAAVEIGIWPTAAKGPAVSTLIWLAIVRMSVQNLNCLMFVFYRNISRLDVRLSFTALSYRFRPA